MKRIVKNISFFLLGLILLSCNRFDTGVDSEYELFVPSHFPEMKIPDDNPITEAKVKLGKMMFEDVRLSKDNSVSCVSCHNPSNAFSDTLALSLGVEGRVGERNSTPIFNIGYHPAFFRDGGALTLELQIVGPIENELEMDINIVELCEKLNQIEEYRELAQAEFGTEVTPAVITKSIASYLRTLISSNSRYDQYLQGDKSVLSQQELNGQKLFDGKAGCFKCHDGFDFTDYSYQNIGLYKVYNDLGRMKLTADSSDLGLFMVPSLRNLSYTAPYMHDGSLATLDEVIDLYNEGGKDHFNQSFKIFPLNLTEQEKTDLKAFLLTLNDESFVNNEH
ncbi:MAG: c-type cytochrome [Flavobacteriales bacterium]|nr:c-type cytochrome [Flavobacteriales bacterium]